MKRAWHYASHEVGLWAAAVGIFNGSNIAIHSADAWSWAVPAFFLVPLALSLWQAEKNYRGKSVQQGNSLMLISAMQALALVTGIAALLSSPTVATSALFSTAATGCLALAAFLVGHHINDPNRIPKQGLGKTVGSPQFISAAGLTCVGLSGLFGASQVDLLSWSSVPAELATVTALGGVLFSSSHKVERYVPQAITAAAALLFAVGGLINGNWLPAAAAVCSSISRLVAGRFYYENRSGPSP